MKNTFRIFALLFLLTNYSCKSQQLVQIPIDAHKLKQNEQQYFNKPLSNLLKEIKPEIKMADGTLDATDYFTFKFVTYDEYKKGVEEGKKYTSIYVYVKERINWKRENRPKDKEFVWTKEDAEKYDNYTVVWMRVIGND